MSFDEETLPVAWVGTAYAASIKLYGGLRDIDATIVGLPPGISASLEHTLDDYNYYTGDLSVGEIKLVFSGTPQATGPYTVEVQLKDCEGTTETLLVPLEVADEFTCQSAFDAGEPCSIGEDTFFLSLPRLVEPGVPAKANVLIAMGSGSTHTLELTSWFGSTGAPVWEETSNGCAISSDLPLGALVIQDGVFSKTEAAFVDISDYAGCDVDLVFTGTNYGQAVQPEGMTFSGRLIFDNVQLSFFDE